MKERKPRRKIKENDETRRAASFNLRLASPSPSFLPFRALLLNFTASISLVLSHCSKLYPGDFLLTAICIYITTLLFPRHFLSHVQYSTFFRPKNVNIFLTVETKSDLSYRNTFNKCLKSKPFANDLGVTPRLTN